MKNKYAALPHKTGAHKAGIVSIKIVPREWIEFAHIIDFTTRIITNEISIVGGPDWLELELTPNSYEFEEKPRSSKPGSFMEITAGGVLNNFDSDLQAVLDTLRNHEVIALLYDKKKQLRVVGDKDAAMVFTYQLKMNGGQEVTTISMTMESEYGAPYYTP